ncbi:arylsulfatase [Portibacter lacus]|uniref:Arylsulfatase n=1 Tax=Portibacter lacus TaxID=1099794 RepID=A0AA37SQ69_9BACT|nr:arylsulfatase [Portibacter lacus]GLR18946.1 arylsulfatase [Portibacter lacus]
MLNLRSVSLFVIQLILLSSCTNTSNSSSEKNITEDRPNIIYILADDLGYGDLSFTGQQHFSTPNIDKLAKGGMFFTQHYAGATVCAPSRSALMTGLHTGHTYIRGNKGVKPEGQYPIDDEALTVAEILKKGGYVTGAFGKWGLGPVQSEGDPNRQGIDQFFGYNCQTLAHNYYPFHLWDNQNKVILEDNSGDSQTTYAPEVIHQNALSFIEKNRDTSFFMFYPSVIPHAELLAPSAEVEPFIGKVGQEKPYKGTEDGPRYRLGGYGSQELPHATFAAMVTILDKQVGDVINKLEQLGIAENTLIIFTSDNGPHKEGGADPDFFNSNGPFKGYKRDLYEGGIRVPTIAYWPKKIKAGTKSDHISAFWDFLPTACDIANQPKPKNIDGISFLPSMLGEEQKTHDYLYWEFHEQGGKQAVRMGKWKGIKLKMANNFDAPIALYNLEMDLREENDVSANNPQIVEEMKRIMKKEHEQSEVFSFAFESS